MVFVPSATCETLVPDTFAVLLSQRRRWINSTVHNLFELVLVNDLCGTFCCSMQFVIFMELVGTLVLPDVFQDQDKPDVMYAQAGLDAEGIARSALGALGIDAASISAVRA